MKTKKSFTLPAKCPNCNNRNLKIVNTKGTKDSTLKRFMARLEKLDIPVEDIMRARIADRRGNLAKNDRAKYPFMFKYILKKIRKIQVEDQALKVSDLAIGGKDLIELELEPGPSFGVILKDCLNNVIDDNLENNREELLRYVEDTYITKIAMRA